MASDLNQDAREPMLADDAQFLRAFHAADPMADAIMTLRNAGVSLGAVCRHDERERYAAFYAASTRVWQLWEAKIIESRGEAGDLQARLDEALKASGETPQQLTEDVRAQIGVWCADIEAGTHQGSHVAESIIELVEEALTPRPFKGSPGAYRCDCGVWLFANGYEADGAAHVHRSASFLPSGERPEDHGRPPAMMTCGAWHPDAARNEACRKTAAQMEGYAGPEGCGESRPWMSLFRCGECSRYFDHDCLTTHFANHRSERPRELLPLDPDKVAAVAEAHHLRHKALWHGNETESGEREQRMECCCGAKYSAPNDGTALAVHYRHVSDAIVATFGLPSEPSEEAITIAVKVAWRTVDEDTIRGRMRDMLRAAYAAERVSADTKQGADLMRYFRCKCGKSEALSSMGVNACQGCPDCKTTLAEAPSGHREIQPHQWVPTPIETDSGEAFVTRCARCGERWDGGQLYHFVVDGERHISIAATLTGGQIMVMAHKDPSLTLFCGDLLVGWADEVMLSRDAAVVFRTARAAERGSTEQNKEPK